MFLPEVQGGEGILPKSRKFRWERDGSTFLGNVVQKFAHQTIPGR